MVYTNNLKIHLNGVLLLRVLPNLCAAGFISPMMSVDVIKPEFIILVEEDS